jgi:hypothetical protein
MIYPNIYPNCLFCHQEMVRGYCQKDKLLYWALEEIVSIERPWGQKLWDFARQHPNQPIYNYRDVFYTVPQMERIAKLKAFL